MLQEAYHHRPELPTLREATPQKELIGAGKCLDYLLMLSEQPDKRDARVIAVSEPILDVFFPVHGSRPGRESQADELIIENSPEFNLGGGTNVARGLAPFAKEVILVTRVGGRPPFNQEMGELLNGLPANVDRHVVVDAESSNAVKIRYVDSEGNVMYCMNHQPKSLGEEAEAKLLRKMHELSNSLNGNESIVVSDYGRGLCSPRVMEAISRMHLLQEGVKIIVDPRPGRDVHKYNIRGALLKPNRTEAEQLTGIKINGYNDPESFRKSAQIASGMILDTFPHINGVLLTGDKDGSIYHSRAEKDAPVHTKLPVHFGDTKNPSGAGDIVIASIALLQRKFPKEDCLQTAMLLASKSVTEPGTSTLSPQLVRETQQLLRNNH